MAAGATANNTTPFRIVLPCSLTCGTTLNFTLTVTYAGGSSPQTFNFSFATGTAGTPGTFSYTGPPVPIPDSSGADVGGTPVTVPLVVSGVTGGIFDVQFRIDGTSCNATAGSTTV